MEAHLQELQQQPGPTSPDNMATDAPNQQQQHQQQQQHPSSSQGQGQVTAGTTTPPAQQQSGPAAAAAAASPSSPLWHNLPGTPGPGCGLTNNNDVLACRADWLFYQGRFEDAYQLTSVLLAQDPYATQALTTHLAAALQLGKKNELFLRCVDAWSMHWLTQSEFAVCMSTIASPTAYERQLLAAFMQRVCLHLAGLPPSGGCLLAALQRVSICLQQGAHKVLITRTVRSAKNAVLLFPFHSALASPAYYPA